MKKQPARPAFLPLLGRFLPKIIGNGRLTVIDSRGGISHFGEDGDLANVAIRFHDRWLPARIALNPQLAAAQAYIEGRLTIEQGTLRQFLALVMSNLAQAQGNALDRFRSRLKRAGVRLSGGNRKRRAARNVSHHYDLTPEFYSLFLDREMHYSCAYFPEGNETLEQAQAAKVRHIAAKMCLSPDQRVLDIGSGWGSMAMALARETGAKVTGVTLSAEQLAAARKRAEQASLSKHVDFRLEDYRDVSGKFDRIVSVGMLEHVGRNHLTTYFAKVAGLLEQDGVALIHSIGRWDGDTGSDGFTERYIFPGGHIPSLSEVIPAIERSGLLVTDIEILRLHYAETLRHWSERFAARRAEACRMYDEQFCRMWEFYLVSAERSFRNAPLMVFQIQLAHRRDAVPLTRDYVARAEREMARLDEPSVKEVA